MKNKLGLVAGVIAAMALIISAYAAYSVAMNDGAYETPSLLIEFSNYFHLNNDVADGSEIKSIAITLFDDTKRIIFYTVAMLFVLISSSLSVISYRRGEYSLYYSSAVLFSLSTIAVINSVLFIAYIVIIMAYAYYDKQKKMKNT